MTETTSSRAEIESRILELEETFERQLRARGFDPTQAENVPLTPELAKLRTEREQLLDRLEQLSVIPTERELKAMTEIDRIQDQLKRAYEGGAWHGPSVQEVLKGVTAQQAAARPIPGAHNIWELVLHIIAWEGAGRRRLTGDRAELPDEEDWLRVTDTSEAAWEAVKALLDKGHQEFVKQISQVADDRLDQPILPGLSTVYVTLQGVIQHDLYHAGQIAILKKAVAGVK